MAKPNKSVINPKLEKFINKLLVEVENDPTATLTDKCKILDRALKLEALKSKIGDDEWGSGFDRDSDDE